MTGWDEKTAGVERCNQHPNRRAVDHCHVCGKALCQECMTADKGKTYCGVHKFPGMRKRRQFNLKEAEAPDVSPRSLILAWALLLLGGVAGVHRIYLGRLYSGMIFLVLMAAYRYAAGHFPDRAHPVMLFAALFLFGAAGYMVIGVTGSGFLFKRMGLGEYFGFRSGSYGAGRLGGWIDRRMGWGHKTPILPPWFDEFMVFAVVLTGIVVFVLKSSPRGQWMGASLLLIPPAMSGIFWARDAVLLFRRRLTDWRGRVVL